MAYDYEQDPILKKIQTAIVKAVAPSKIVLFGSRARGDASDRSDYDILVIKDQVKNEREITRAAIPAQVSGNTGRLSI